MNIQSSALADNFSSSLQRWRKHRKLSQLELALNADVSQRHVSWLETGRSQPSREMVVKLSEAMQLPLRDRNQMLNRAGYAALYSESSLEEPDMSPVVNALQRMLEHHEPYPAIVVDRLWNVRMKNQAANMLFQITGDAEQLWADVGDSGEHNLALLTVHPKGLRQFISNFDEVAGAFVRRLQREATECGDPKVYAKLMELSVHLQDIDQDAAAVKPLLPILPLEFGPFPGDTPTLSLFSVISTFGTPQDITADELRIETFYPTDKATAKFFSQK